MALLAPAGPRPTILARFHHDMVDLAQNELLVTSRRFHQKKVNVARGAASKGTDLGATCDDPIVRDHLMFEETMQNTSQKHIQALPAMSKVSREHRRRIRANLRQ